MQHRYECRRDPYSWLDSVDMNDYQVGDLCRHGFFSQTQKITEVFHDTKEVKVVDAETGDEPYRTSVIHLTRLG